MQPGTILDIVLFFFKNVFVHVTTSTVFATLNATKILRDSPFQGVLQYSTSCATCLINGTTKLQAKVPSAYCYLDSSRKAWKPIKPAELRSKNLSSFEKWPILKRFLDSFTFPAIFWIPIKQCALQCGLLFRPIVLFGMKCTKSWYFSSSNMRALPTWVDKVHDKDRVEQWWELWFLQIFFFLFVAILIQNIFAWQHLRSRF